MTAGHSGLVPAEQVIAAHMHRLYSGMVIEECAAFRVTRNEDLEVDEDEGENLLVALEKEDARLFSDTVAYTNVENSLEEIISGSDIIIDLFSKGEIGVVGAVYNVSNGKVDFFKNLTPKIK